MPQRYVTPASAEALHGDHHAASDHHGASDAPDPAGSLAHKCQICFTLQHAGTFVPPSVSDTPVVVVEWRHRPMAASTWFVPFRRYASFETRTPPSRGCSTDHRFASQRRNPTTDSPSPLPWRP